MLQGAGNISQEGSCNGILFVLQKGKVFEIVTAFACYVFFKYFVNYV